MSSPNGDVAERIRTARAGRHLLLLLDFDGTLCEFAPAPDDVVLPPPVAAALRALDARSDVTLGFVSGRRADDLRRHLPSLPRSYIAGCHGLEIEGPDTRFVPDGARDGAECAHAIAARMAGELTRWPGAFVEDKGWSVALHVRNASPDDATAAAARWRDMATPDVAAGRVRLLEGACVTEVMPAIAWHKGSALTWIRARVAAREGPLCCVFAGDDVTDDDAFRALDGTGLSIAVGPRHAVTDCRVAGPGDLARVLQQLS